MYDVVIIGGTLSGLFTSINLSKSFKICIIDINQEIGFPTNFPGIINNPILLDNFLTEKDKLYLKENELGLGLRSEWLMKYLTHNAARNGVDILNRTRVLNIFFDDYFNIELIGAGPQNHFISSKIIIDEEKLKLVILCERNYQENSTIKTNENDKNVLQNTRLKYLARNLLETLKDNARIVIK